MKAVEHREIDIKTFSTSSRRSDGKCDDQKASDEITRVNPHPKGHHSIVEEEDITKSH
jgi:hypothetical protein